MPPFFLLLAQLLPGLSSLLAGDKTGDLLKNFAEEVKKVTEKDNEAEAKSFLEDDGNLAKKLELQQKLAELALQVTEEQNRAKTEQQEIDVELYKLESEQRDREREDEFKRLEMDMKDRFDARSRQDKLAEDHSPLAWVAPILALSLVAMVFYLLRGILVAREPVINKDVFNVVLGALVTAFTTVIAFYFGSSVGSRDKDRAVSSGRLISNPKTVPSEDGSTTGEDDGGEPDRSSTRTPGQKDPSGGATPKPLPPSFGPLGTFRQKAPHIMQNLRDDLGLSPEQAAGILGNIGVECGEFRHMQELRPISGRGGYGWMQWTASRRVAFESWAQKQGLDKSSDEANYGFLIKELKGTESASLASLRRQTTAAGAAEDFMLKNERPGVPNLGNRARLARVALLDYKAVYHA